MRPRLKQIEKANAVYRRNESYRGSSRIKLRCAVITGSNLGLAAHGNNKTEILNRNVVDELIPEGAVRGDVARGEWVNGEGRTRWSWWRS